jgi:site-specific recombinase XerD
MAQHNKTRSKSGGNEIPHPDIQRWLEALKQQGKSQLTLAAYTRGLTHFAAWRLGAYGTPFEPAAIIPRDMRDWKAYQQMVEKAAPMTINQRMVALTRFFPGGRGRSWSAEILPKRPAVSD